MKMRCGRRSTAAGISIPTARLLVGLWRCALAHTPSRKSGWRGASRCQRCFTLRRSSTNLPRGLPKLGYPDGLGLERYAEEFTHSRLNGVAQRGDIRSRGVAVIGKSECVASRDRSRAQAIAFDEPGALQQPCRGELYLIGA